MTFINKDSATLASASVSSSTTSHWVLLRGLAREARHWDDFPDKLKSALSVNGDTARIDAIDLPGAGRFSEMKSPLTIGEITDFAREKFIEIRRRQRERGETPSERTRLFSLSMGGMIAADWMDRWPDDFKEVILANTSFRGFSPVHHRLTPHAVKHLLMSLAPADNFARELHGMKLVSNLTNTGTRREIAQRWSKFADERPISLENFSRQLLAAALFRAPLEKPDVPILVLYSEKDRMVSPACSKEIIERWKTASAVHPTAGHDLTIDDADWVVEQIVQWERSLKDFPDSVESSRHHP